MHPFIKSKLYLEIYFISKGRHGVEEEGRIGLERRPEG